MRHVGKILRYEMYNLLRSKWVIGIGLFFFVTTLLLLRFGGRPEKTIVSIVNVMLMTLPLLSMVLGMTYFYNSREFIELLLAQPVARGAIFAGKFGGLALSLALVFALGITLPFLFYPAHARMWAAQLALIVAVGIAFLFIFVALAFAMASWCEDRVKGLGMLIVVWLALAVMYDAGMLFLIYAGRDYPLEKPLLALTLLNPIDLGRILILLQLDIAALMGYTGAVMRKFFGSGLGIGITCGCLLLWAALPFWLGLRHFARKDF